MHPHPAPFPTQIPPLLKTRRPSFQDDYTGPIGMNGRFDPLFGDEFPDGTQIPPLLLSLNLGRMGSSARQRSTCAAAGVREQLELQESVPIVEDRRFENIVRIVHDAEAAAGVGCSEWVLR
ncbi:hypothetical protein B0H14DRAFT_3497601 [Mycena olivaceomarginata]|nr:hypothetical protein B0H14DRAFT_3497601 [Mycena olivaceomarginata]